MLYKHKQYIKAGFWCKWYTPMIKIGFCPSNMLNTIEKCEKKCYNPCLYAGHAEKGKSL